MPASTRLGAVGAVIAGCLLATTAPGAPAQAASPLITVAMASSGNPAPRYEIRVRNGTDGMVRTTVRQELPPGAIPSMISQGGQPTAPGTRPGQVGTEVVWQVQLGARGATLLTTALVPPPAGLKVTAPACAFVSGGSMPYDCATATWDPSAPAAADSGPNTSVRAEDAGAVPWWRRGIVLGAAIAVLVLLAVAGGALWWRRLRRRRAADRVNAMSLGELENRATRHGVDKAADKAARQQKARRRAADNRAAEAARRLVRRSGSPIARARARVRGDHKIPVPDSVRRATGHPRIGGAAEPADWAGHSSPVEDGRRGGPDAVVDNDAVRPGDGLLRDGGLAQNAEPAGEPVAEMINETVDGRADGPAPDGQPVGPGGLVGIAGGARYVGQAAVPPRTPAPGPEQPADPPPAQPPEQGPDEVSPAVGRARPAPHPATAYRPSRRRPKPPAWLAVGMAALLAVALATITVWTGSSQVSAISADQQPSSGAWVGRTVAGPVGTSLRESAFEFTVYRLVCPPAPGGCQAILGVRNLTDKSQQWHGTLQRAYLPSGDWVGADVPATQTANAGKDPFADPVPAGERMIMPLVFASTGPSAPTRIELRSAVFSAGVSVDVPH